MINKIKYKIHQDNFIEKYYKKIQSISGYTAFLKHVSKKDPIQSELSNIALYDVLDNDGMTKLIKSIYKLKKRRNIEVHHLNYRKKNLRKLNYINSQKYNWASIVKLKFHDDKWIREVNILYTNLNDSEIIIQYDFNFKVVLNNYVKVHDFVMDNIINLKLPYFLTSYIDDKFFDNVKYIDIFSLEYELFVDILQTFITNNLYSKHGNRYKLPVEYSYRIKRHNKRKDRILKNSFLQLCYYKEGMYILYNNFLRERAEFEVYSRSKYLTKPILLEYFSKYSMEFYLIAFNDFETNQLEKRMRKYLNSNKKNINSNDLKWFIVKIKQLTEEKSRIITNLKSNSDFSGDILGWELYVNNQKWEEDFLQFPKKIDHFLDKYNQNFDYLKSLSTVQNDRIIIWVTLITLALTVAGILISIID